MGGGSSSIVKTNVRTRSAVEAVANNIMNCKSNTIAKQTFILSGNYNVLDGVKMVQNLKLSQECAQDTKNIADLQQSVSTALKTAAEAQSVSVLGALGNSKAKTDTFIDNEVSQKITQQTILNIINNTNAEQEMIISGDRNIVKNFEMTQTMDLLYKNTQQVLNEMKSVQVIEGKSESGAKATQTNFISDIVDSVFGGLAKLGALWVVVIVVVVIFLGKELITGFMKGGPVAAIMRGDPQQQQMQYQQQPQMMPMPQYQPMPPMQYQPMQPMPPMQQQVASNY